MRSALTTGRAVGVLLLVQLIGLSLPFILLFPTTSTTFLESASTAAFQTRTAVFILFANALLTTGIAIWAFPVFREYSSRLAVLFVVVSVVWVVMQSVDNAQILSMMSLSQQYAGSGGANSALYEIVAASVRSTRRWVHLTELLVIDFWFLVFYAILFRFGFVPRLLAGFGLLAVVLHAAGIPLPVFAGYSSFMPLGWSLAVSHVLIGGWLIAKGFSTKDSGSVDSTRRHINDKE